MKKVYILLVMLLFAFPPLSAQNILKEPFAYPVRDSLDNLGGWSVGNPSGEKVKVVSPGLTYAGYAGGGTGNAIRFLNKGNGSVCTKTLVKMDTGTVYVSYLLRVDTLTPLSFSGYNISMEQFGGPTNVNMRTYVERKTDSTFRLGIVKTEKIVYSPKSYKVKQVYLVVMKYRFVPEPAKDTAALYVFSAGVPSAEPTIADTIDVAGNDAVDIGEIWLSNAFNDVNLKGSVITMDEIRVGRTWDRTVNEPVNTVLSEDFLYAPGDSLNGKNGWAALTGGPILRIDSNGLSYPGMTGSGVGRSLKVFGGSGSQTLYRPFLWSAVDSSIYLWAIVKFTGASAAPGYFLSLANTGAGNYRASIHAKIDSGKVQFGASALVSSTPVFGGVSSSADNPFVVALKYRIIAGANNDQVSLYVFTQSSVPGTEPASPTVGPLTMPNETFLPSTVALNSGSFSAGTSLSGATWLLDHIRVGNAWSKGVTGVKNLPVSAPREFSLDQNFPNPFNPTTTIRFTPGTSALTTLTVYDMLGREVAVLVHDRLEGGRVYEYPFDGARLSSGVYLYRLTSGNVSETKKMVLMK